MHGIREDGPTAYRAAVAHGETPATTGERQAARVERIDAAQAGVGKATRFLLRYDLVP